MKKFKSFDLDSSSKPISPTEKVKNFLEQLSTFIEDTVTLDQTEDAEKTFKNDSQEEIILASPPHCSPFTRKRRKSYHRQKSRILTPKEFASLKYDQKNNFYPEPGSSKNVEAPKSDTSIESFYEKSFLVNSPQLFSQSPGSAIKSLFRTPKSNDAVVITPLELPPDFSEVDVDCLQFNIEEHSYQVPYFSQSEDMVQKRQVGYNVLQIPGNTLNDVKEFEGSLPNCSGLASYRKEVLAEIEGSLVANQFRTHQAVREYISSDKHVIITPLEEAPTSKDCYKWLKAREKNINNEDKKAIDEDSPINVKRQKIIMVVESDFSESPCNLTITPLTCDSKDKTLNVSIQLLLNL